MDKDSMKETEAKALLVILARQQAKLDPKEINTHDLELFGEDSLLYEEAKRQKDSSALKGIVVIDLNTPKALYYTDGELEEKYKKMEIKLKHGPEDEEPKAMFPLAVDDYFMSVAILATHLSSDKKSAACVVSATSMCVYSIGFIKEAKENPVEEKDCMCAVVKIALKEARKNHVDLTKCHLYTTCESICEECTVRIVTSGIKVVVHNGKDNPPVDDKAVCHKVCFKKYRCCIRTKDDDDRFFRINLSERKVADISLVYEKKKKKIEESDGAKDTGAKAKDKRARDDKHPDERLSYTDFFMAMAFLANTRSKAGKYQVGACLVTSSPHRLVAMAYNGMPDGRGFKDSEMDWGSNQKDHNCHSEVNVIIAAFRREADLSDCTLYVTHSPCHDCSKLIAQSGIKNVVFAKYYHWGEDMYEILGRLPDMNLTRYEYRKTGYGNIAHVVISLKEPNNKPKTSLHSSDAIPETGWKVGDEYGCPSCLRKQHDPKEEEPKHCRTVDLPLDDYYMSIALLASSRSHLKEKLKAGACLVYLDPRRVISVGYSGLIDGKSDGKMDENKHVCCAEMNAIVSAFRYHADLTNATLYTTGYPCPRCAIKIVQSGIKTVVHGGLAPSEELAEREAGGESGKSKEYGPAEDTFYWGNISTLKYECKIKKPYIDIDLQKLDVHQTEEDPRGDAGQQ